MEAKKPKKLTQKEKIRKAYFFALNMKSTAQSLKQEAKEMDVTWPNIYAKHIEDLASEVLECLK